MIIFDAARKINKYRKMRKKAMAGRYLSPVRRIERVSPQSGQRYVAMTFDDGPSAAPPRPVPGGIDLQTGLTDLLCQILDSYNAKGTFDVIGTTEFNYPDKAGKEHHFTWSGTKFDHYPDFDNDKLAGIANQINIARALLESGHELANHGFRHILFGPMRFFYGTRTYFHKLAEVIYDLSTLHTLVKSELGYEMHFSRPPHYIDNIPDGFSAYDAYRDMGYQYLAASFDGGGWLPTVGNYDDDTAKMVKPLETALLADPNSLNGQIIFQKDGYNMSHQTPVADALPLQLNLLRDNGYKVITASELISLSPFEDLTDAHPCFASARELANANHCIGYKNNTFQPDRLVTHGELAMMLTPPEVLRQKHAGFVSETINSYNLAPVGSLLASQSDFADKPSKNLGKHAYADAFGWCFSQGLISDIKNYDPEKLVTTRELGELIDSAVKVGYSKTSKLDMQSVNSPTPLNRGTIINIIKQICL